MNCLCICHGVEFKDEVCAHCVPPGKTLPSWRPIRAARCLRCGWRFPGSEVNAVAKTAACPACQVKVDVVVWTKRLDIAYGSLKASINQRHSALDYDLWAEQLLTPEGRRLLPGFEYEDAVKAATLLKRWEPALWHEGRTTPTIQPISLYGRR